jgi:hypothetical protein
MWRYYNPNPAGRMVGDCSVRAISAALDASWDEAFDLLAHNAREMCDMPSADAVIGSVLRLHGFVRSIIPSSCPDCYTIGEFAEDFPRGVCVLGTGQHVATVIDGVILDSWDSSNEIPMFMWRRI